MCAGSGRAGWVCRLTRPASDRLASQLAVFRGAEAAMTQPSSSWTEDSFGAMKQRFRVWLARPVSASVGSNRRRRYARHLGHSQRHPCPGRQGNPPIQRCHGRDNQTPSLPFLDYPPSPRVSPFPSLPHTRCLQSLFTASISLLFVPAAACLAPPPAFSNISPGADFLQGPIAAGQFSRLLAAPKVTCTVATPLLCAPYYRAHSGHSAHWRSLPRRQLSLHCAGRQPLCPASKPSRPQESPIYQSGSWSRRTPTSITAIAQTPWSLPQPPIRIKSPFAAFPVSTPVVCWPRQTPLTTYRNPRLI